MRGFASRRHRDRPPPDPNSRTAYEALGATGVADRDAGGGAEVVGTVARGEADPGADADASGHWVPNTVGFVVTDPVATVIVVQEDVLPGTYGCSLRIAPVMSAVMIAFPPAAPTVTLTVPLQMWTVLNVGTPPGTPSRVDARSTIATIRSTGTVSRSWRGRAASSTPARPSPVRPER